ncbi:hypothetical protein VTN31DRAFT_2698 [Thermomyces dupontii]|uniref:uncharacterized protein n=1 Tax=Talaromyces thermophilus TaxID=28565 RepID=UPI003741EEFF
MQYTPFASDIELPFYTSLASLKVNHDKLDDSARKVLGLYEIRASDAPPASCRMQIHGNALTSDDVPSGFYRAEGIIKNFNTIEEYRNADKAAMLHQSAKTIWDAIHDGTIYSCPSLLASFLIISFADLKKYKFHYWFAFPVIPTQPSWVPAAQASTAPKESSEEPSIPGSRRLSSKESSGLVEAVQTWRYGIDARQHGFFLARKESAEEIHWKVASLDSYESGFFDGAKPDDCYVCFADPSNYPDAPGWMLRNLLALVRHRWKLQKVQILCYRDVQSRRDAGRSFSVTLQIDTSKAGQVDTTQESDDQMPKPTGWERNSSGKLAGRLVDLAAYMDPRKLADQAVDLNLKLIKWRISPNLDLDKIKVSKCLLLGAGTLGSYVARNLLGWGVRHVTFVDNATVSFSNPVRQPLYNFSDCLDGGAKKAIRASEALKEIYPGVTTAGHMLTVPMPGHPVTDAEKAHAEFKTLEKLIEDHDAIFLLMDSRESRWLPTVIGKAKGKIVMNAALGFDTFVVMRHGVRSTNGDREPGLGCYFCNDVVAPMNSLKDQTLDQQCTVTRPGVSAIASALLVELFVSVVQHPDGPAAPAPAVQNPDQGNHPLGLVPHQIRGYLSNFSNVTVTGRSYGSCSACSDRILQAYEEEGWEFVQKALDNREYIEELSGLKEVQRAAEATAAEVEWEDDSDGFISE